MICPAIRLSSFLAPLIALFITGSVSSHAKILEGRLATSAASIGARVGASVSVDKDLIVVGAPDDDEAGPFAGAVFVFARKGNSWEKQAKLLGPNPRGFRSFGESVAADGDTIVVGAPFDGPQGDASGVVYVYHRSGKNLSLQARLVPNDSAVNQLFGDTIAIDNDTIVVGAFLDSAGAQNAGAAYVFSRTGQTWSQRAKLTASNASAFGFFGSAVAVSGNTVVVGAPTAESAYVFSLQHGSWTEEAVLAAADASTGDFSAFGAAVSIDHSTLVVGAPLEGTPAPLTGAAYVFAKKGNRWDQQKKLTAKDGALEDEFGTSVAIDGGHIAVGAPFHGDGNSGAVYLFASHAHDWREQSQLTGNPPTPFFGSSVALDGNALVAGAPGFVEFTGQQSAGSAYIFPAR